MTAYLLAPNARWQGRDPTGQPIIGGLLYTYRNGTLIPKATYQDAAGMIPNTNPVVLDGKGEANIYWADDELYSIQLWTSINNLGITRDVEVYSQDDYPELASAPAPVTLLQDNHNLVRNAQFTFWNNTTTHNNIAKSANRYDTFCDDWTFERNNLNATINITQQTFALGQTQVPANPVYYTRYQCSAVGGGSETYKFIGQYYRSCQTLSGRTVSVAIVAASSTLSQISVSLTQYFGSGGSPSSPVSTTVLTQTLTSTMTRYTATIALPSVAGKTLGTNGDDALILQINMPLNAVATVDIANIQLHDLDKIIDFPYESQDAQYKQLNSVVDYGVFLTGDHRMTLRTVAANGWILCNDGTIGNAASGASYAGIFTKALFTLIWNNVSNSYAPILDSSGAASSRGANAQADYEANKRLSLTKALGRVLGTAGTATMSSTFTADTSTDQLAIADATSFYTGTPVTLTTTGTLPNPLAPATTYYAIYIDATHIKLATTLANALIGSSIDITTTGSGVHTAAITYSNLSQGQFLGEFSHAQAGMEVGGHPHGFTPSGSFSGGAFVNGNQAAFGGDFSALQNNSANNLVTAFPSVTFTASAATDQLTLASSLGFYTGAALTVQGGTLPNPLTTNTVYYAIVIDGTHIKLATSLANALAGTAINLTTDGSPTSYVYPQVSPLNITQPTVFMTCEVKF